jgi:hypothetical protein
MSKAQPQPCEDNFTPVLVTTLTEMIIIPQGEIDVHESVDRNEWRLLAAKPQAVIGLAGQRKKR